MLFLVIINQFIDQLLFIDGHLCVFIFDHHDSVLSTTEMPLCIE